MNPKTWFGAVSVFDRAREPWYCCTMDKFEFTQEEKTKLERLGVAALILFGSRAQGLARPKSDYDIGVLLADKRILYNHERRTEVYDALYDITSEKIRQLLNIDIVFLEDAPAELQAHTAKYGIPIFEADPRAFPRFKEYVMLMYADFAPYREMFHRAILSRISS